MLYLLDTNALSDLVRRPRGAVGRKVRLVGAAAVKTSVIVVAEARFGIVKGGSVKLSDQFGEVLDRLDVAQFESPADTIYADIRYTLERAGTPIGALDMLIAAHALALDCTLVTANEREFRRVPGLRVENWLH